MPVPARCPDLLQAAAIPEVFLTAYQCCRIAGLAARAATPPPPGQRPMHFLVHAGASGVGTALCQIVRALGGECVVTASADKLLDPVLQRVCPKWRFARAAAPAASAPEGDAAAATATTRPKTPPPAPLPAWVAQIEAALGKNCIDAVVDPVVGSGYLDGDIELLRTDGTIVVLATMGGSVVPRFDVARLFRKRGTLVGSTLRNRDNAYKAALVRDFMANVYPLLFAEGDGGVAPIVSSVLPMEQVQSAQRIIENNEVIGKVVLSWGDAAQQ